MCSSGALDEQRHEVADLAAVESVVCGLDCVPESRNCLEMVNATGQGRVRGLEPYPVGPIPFVRFNNEWKLSRVHVCGILTVLANLPDSSPSARNAYQCE